MQTEDTRGVLGAGADLIDIEIGGVGGQDRVGFRHPVQFGEDLFFHVHVFEDGFDHQIHLGQGSIINAAAQTRFGFGLRGG